MILLNQQIRPGTSTQIYIQLVLVVKGRESLMGSQWEEKLYRYISGVVRNKKQKMLAINVMPDHIHFLIGMNPTCCLDDLVREIKNLSMNSSTRNDFQN